MLTRGKAYLALVAIGSGWGLTQPLGKIAAMGGQGAFGLIFWQLVTVLAVLVPLALVLGKPPQVTRHALRFYVVVALLGTVIPNYTFYLSIARLPSGVMSILISTIPLIALPINIAIGTERLDPQRALGLLLGLGAMLMIMLPDTALPDRAMLAFLPLAMVGPLCYALENTYVARSGLAEMDPIAAMIGVTIVALVLVGPLMVLSGQAYLPGWTRPDAALVLSSALHGCLYASFIWLAARTGAVFSSQSGYVTTLSGLVFATIIVGERLSPWVLGAVALLFAGMALVKPRRAPPTAA